MREPGTVPPDVLAVVEREQHVAAAQGIAKCDVERRAGKLTDAERQGDMCLHEVGIRHRDQVDDCDAVDQVRRRASGGLEGKPRLPDPANAHERDKARSREEVANLVELSTATHESGQGRRQAGRRMRRNGGGRGNVLAQNRGLERLEVDAGINPELLGERRPCPVVRPERVRLPPGAIERDHQEAPEPFPERVPRDERLELVEKLRVLSELEIGFDPRFEHVHVQLLETGRLRPEDPVHRRDGDRLAAPQLERRSKVSSCAAMAPALAGVRDHRGRETRSGRRRSTPAASRARSRR